MIFKVGSVIYYVPHKAKLESDIVKLKVKSISVYENGMFVTCKRKPKKKNVKETSFYYSFDKGCTVDGICFTAEDALKKLEANRLEELNGTNK